MGGPAGSEEAARRCTEAIRDERLRMQAREGAAINKTVGPTLIDRATPSARFARGRGALTPNFFAEPPELESQMVGNSDNSDPVRFM